MAIRRQRRTQQERSADTSEKLLNATIDLLHDRGFYRMSTSEIAEAAGLSRGALTHHFSSKEEIIIEAVGYMLRKVTAELHEMAEGIRFSGSSTDEIVDYLWRMMDNRLFYVTMEYLPEARHNPEFREKIVLVVKEFHEGLNAVWAEVAAQAGVHVDQVLVLMNATMCIIRGMIAQTAVKDDPAYFQELLQFWKQHVKQEFKAVVAASPVARPVSRIG